MSETQVFIIPGGRVVHLTTRCIHMRRAQGKHEQKTLLQAKAMAGGEPRICELCVGITKKAARR